MKVKYRFLKHHIVYSLIIIFLAIILFMSECNKSINPIDTIKIDGKKYDVLGTRIDTVFVSVKPSVIYRKGKDIYRDTIIYKELRNFINVGLEDGSLEKYYDSVLGSHFSISVFKDTINFGKYGDVYITDSIQQNTILSRMANSSLIFSNVSNTTIVQDRPRNQLYLGAKSMIINNGIGGFGAGLILKSKTDKLYGAGLMVDRQKNINFTLDLYIKL